MLYYEQNSRGSAWSQHLQILSLVHSLSLHAQRPLLFATRFEEGQQLRDMRLPSLFRYCAHVATPSFYCEILDLPHFALTDAANDPLMARLNLFRLTQCRRVVSIDAVPSLAKRGQTSKQDKGPATCN